LKDEANFDATVRCRSSVPTLLLEDFEHLTDSIACQPGLIAIELSSSVDRVAAESTFLGLEGGGMIPTSHYGCNDHGERQLFK
jgi:hypothetical protein